MALANADLLADDHLAMWLVENSPIKIPFFQAWSWQLVAGKSLIYPRTTELTQASAVSACGAPDPQEPTVSQAEFLFTDFITRYQICAVDLDRYQYPDQLDAVMYALAKRRILYAYASMLGNPLEGLGVLAAASRVRDMAAGALTLDSLDDVYERVVAGTGRPTLIMSHSRSLRTYRKLCRDSGYQAERAPWQWYDPAKGRMVEGSVDAFNGTPWLANDFMNMDGKGTEETYMMVAGDDGGQRPTRGVTGIVPSAQGRNMFNKRQVQGILDPNSGGIGIAGMQAGTDNWVSMPAGFALGSQGALSVIKNYATVG